MRPPASRNGILIPHPNRDPLALSHQLLVDADDSGHLLVISQWTSREHADETLRRYATHPNPHTANSLVTEGRPG